MGTVNSRAPTCTLALALRHPQLGTPHCSFPRGVTDPDVDDLGSTLKLLPLCMQNSDVADSRGLWPEEPLT